MSERVEPLNGDAAGRQRGAGRPVWPHALVWRCRLPADWEVRSRIRAMLMAAIPVYLIERLERRRAGARGLRPYVSPRSTDQGAALPPDEGERTRADDVTRAVARILRTMPPRERAVTVLRLRDQMTTPQIATALAISARSVEVHIGRATRRFRAQLPALLGQTEPGRR